MSITPLRFLLALGGILALAVPSTCARTLTLSTVDPSVNTIAIERVLREAYGRLDITLIVERVPPRRALRMAANGQSDGELVRIAGLEFEHDNLILVPVPVGVIEGVVYTTRTPFAVEGWGSLWSCSLGVQRGIRTLERGQYGREVILATRTTQLFKLMKSGRVDTIVVPGLTGIESLRAHGFQGMHRLSPPLFCHDLYHYLHRKNRDLVPAITEVLRRMRSEGRIRQIREDYIKELSCP